MWACSGSLDAHVIHRGVSQRTGHGAGVVAAAGCERHGGDRQPLVIEQHGPRGCGGRRDGRQRDGGVGAIARHAHALAGAQARPAIEPGAQRGDGGAGGRAHSAAAGG